MKKFTIKSVCRGVSGVEILVGVSIAALILVFATHATARFINVGGDMADKTQALYLAEDGLELVRFVRDDSWASISGLANNATYYLDVDPATVNISGTPETIGIFSRSFEVDDVYRESSNDAIVATGGVVDPDTKYVTVTVSWDGGSESVSLTSILAEITP